MKYTVEVKWGTVIYVDKTITKTTEYTFDSWKGAIDFRDENGVTGNIFKRSKPGQMYAGGQPSTIYVLTITQEVSEDEFLVTLTGDEEE